MMKFFAVVVLALVPLAYGGSLMQELAALPDTRIIRDLLNATGLDAVVDAGYFTLFAPSDTAFAKLDNMTASIILGNGTILASVLQLHATQGIFRSMDAANNMLLKSELAGSNIRVNVYNDADGSLFVTLNGAKVTKANIMATNGYLHVIDRVMMPARGDFYEMVAASDMHHTLKAIIDEQKLESFFRTVTGTLFAPTDAAFKVAFDALVAKGFDTKNNVAVREFIMYHLLEQVVYAAGGHAGTYNTFDHGNQVTVSMAGNGTVMINQATVIIGDLSSTNGVVHVIDSVLVPEPWATALIMG